MTPQEVVDILGPPLDFMSLEDLVGNTPVAGVRKPAGFPGRFRKPEVVKVEKPRFRDSVSWLYFDVPPGKETNVTFDNGVVTMARELPYDASDRRLPGHEWTRELMDDHLTRMEADPTYARLVTQSAWRRLRGTEVESFVVTTFAEPPGRYQLGRAARRFGELDVIRRWSDRRVGTAARPDRPDRDERRARRLRWR